MVSRGGPGSVVRRLASGARSATAGAAVALLTACATASSPPLDAEALAAALASRPVVLLGEVHDNAAQHAVRAQALRRLFEAGVRPALAFEQFDRERQAELDRARAEHAGLPPAERADRVIAAAGQPRTWNWDYYRPYVALALAYDVPIVAANLSRADAARVVREGFGAVFDAATIAAYRLEALPEPFLRAHEQAVDEGHCRLLPRQMLAGMARAQIARDVALAQAIAPHAAGGVVLLTGNGHARNDLGVPALLPPELRGRTLSIGLLETGSAAGAAAAAFDVVFTTPAQPRGDPCAPLRPRG